MQYRRVLLCPLFLWVINLYPYYPFGDKVLSDPSKKSIIVKQWFFKSLNQRPANVNQTAISDLRIF